MVGAWRAAGVVGALAVFAAGCGVVRSNLLSDDHTETATITEVRLADAGGVKLTPTDGGPSGIHREVHYRDGGEPGNTTHMEGSVLVLAGCGRNCTVNYTVTVPRGVKVTGRSTDGAIELTATTAVDLSSADGPITIADVTGPVTLDSDDGPITLRRINGEVRVKSRDGAVAVDDISGALTVRSDSGGVTGSELRGDHSEVRSHDGGVRLEPAVPQNVKVNNDDGEIEVVVPADSYTVHTGGGDSHAEVDIPNEPNGRHTIDLTNSDGRIEVRGR